MKNQVFFERWLHYVCSGMQGKEQMVNGSHWFRRDIYFYGDAPSYRLLPVPGRKNKFVLLTKWAAATLPTSMKNSIGEIFLDDIGVFSKYESDYLSGDKLHERIQWFLVMQVQDIADREVPAMSGQSLSENRWAQEQVLKRLDKLYDNYRVYNATLDENWRPLPESFRDRTRATIAEKVAAYRAPHAVMKRERTAAKRMAERVLGLDKNKKK